MTALFVIDVQREYMLKYDAGLLGRINRQIERAAEQSYPVIYIKNVRKLKSGNTAYEFADGLNVCSSHIIYKERASVFSDAKTLDLLRLERVSRIVIIGIDGNCCVASSAIDARKLGFEVVLPCRSIGVQNPVLFEKKKYAMQKLGIEIL